jgi:hypothetical protein
MEEQNNTMIPLPSEEDIQQHPSNLPPLGEGEPIQVDDEKMTDEDILYLWESVLITTQTEVPPLEPAIMVDDVGILTRRDIHGIKAKQKQGKTTVLKVILAALLVGVMFRLKSCLKDPKIFTLTCVSWSQPFSYNAIKNSAFSTLLIISEICDFCFRDWSSGESWMRKIRNFARDS